MLTLGLIFTLSVVCNWVVWLMFARADPVARPPKFVVDVPDYTPDWKGLV